MCIYVHMYICTLYLELGELIEACVCVQRELSAVAISATA